MNPLIELGGAICFFALTAAYLISHLPGPYRLKWVTVPIILALTLVYLFGLPHILGLPYDDYPAQRFQLVAFRDTYESKRHMIELWVTEAGVSRLYRIPYSEQVQQGLQGMAQAKAKGRGKTGQFTGHGAHRGLGTDGTSAGDTDGAAGASPGQGSGHGTNNDSDDIDLTTQDMPSSPLPDKDAQ